MIDDGHGRVVVVLGGDGGEGAVQPPEELVPVGAARHRDVELSDPPGRDDLEVALHGRPVGASFQLAGRDLVKSGSHDDRQATGEREGLSGLLRPDQDGPVDAVDRLGREGGRDRLRLTATEAGQTRTGWRRVEFAAHVGGSLTVPHQQKTHRLQRTRCARVSRRSEHAWTRRPR